MSSKPDLQSLGRLLPLPANKVESKIQNRLGTVQPLQARMLKISAGNEEFGLCGKWLLHGFNIAKLNL